MKTKELNKLIKKVRTTDKYSKWRKKVIKKCDYYKRGMNVHHQVPFKSLFKRYNISTVEEALKCRGLWYVRNGRVIKRGEHRILSWLERLKYPTRDFIRSLNEWLESFDN